jgi:L-iditol 2-dehydrogenase
MKLARYVGDGEIAIVEEAAPCISEGGLLIKTEASGLCSGELMDWYMERKVPHVLGHEVAGKVIESEDERFPVGSRVFPHHHAPCMKCESCAKGLYVHCKQWKSTKLIPGGMAEIFAVPKENLSDTLRVDDLRPQDAALIEPLACVVKSMRSAEEQTRHQSLGLETQKVVEKTHSSRVAIIGLGVMGLMHMLAMRGAVGYEINESRIEWAKNLNLDARKPEKAEEADLVVVCPGNQKAVDQAARMIAPGGTIVLFAPMPPGKPAEIDLNALYFRDARIVSSYSCGPQDTEIAARLIRQGTIKAEHVVSDFISLQDLPRAYQAMKKGDILKAMVLFS